MMTYFGEMLSTLSRIGDAASVQALVDLAGQRSRYPWPSGSPQ
jgi:hypothetical protein